MRHRAGFTLLELMVSMAVGVFVVTAAVAVTTDHSRVLGRASSRLDMHQGARLAIELLSQDVRHAGVGVGYRADGRFAGLSLGNFSVTGGASFQSNDRSVTLEGVARATDDLGIRVAVGDVRTIAAYGASTAEVCAGASYDAGDVVVLTTREGLRARTVKIGPLSASSCSRGACVQGCESFSFTADASYLSDSSAASANYAEGEVAGSFQHLVWFVTPDANGQGVLQRAEVSTARPCSTADESCGGTVAAGVETLQVAFWQWDDLTAQWVDRTTAPDIDGAERVRVDLELVVRALHVDARSGPQEPVTSQLSSECLPAPCGSKDTVPRWVTRASVEIRNSGRMTIR